ncbi:sigma-54-dependent Fis family transcriptional regulator [Dissulfurirhabdus thermomarina]|uniref:Sigma-54-dependent Fis family transcriptional regulator n=1 Tax=Dissulfurirhabdus thermomarina TaxID=1765737 RepID=A0A6N9TPV0_DISTH|nr:sigma-54 dependent transcriptional regulator [Dissulfurirhabdus thermomarina]NDY43301.1 sigma-54-dependent Fis family transcriptional regulator [Dissulfurirhabdus thermomarina]NMX22788.1 sigma-54-dependent Fis family transcriptional regulator [Dissulfurirhabdus thermomarina]
MDARILIVDDDAAIRDGSAQVLGRAGHEISEAATGREALDLLGRYAFDLILLDLKMPDINGLDLLRRIREQDPAVPVVMITAYGTMENAVEAMRLGANDFLSKPFEPEELRLVVDRTLQARRLALENLYLKEELRRQEGAPEIVGRSPALRRLLEQAERVAATDSTVLVTGESGTGKGLLARYIHEASPRRDRPLVAVDCSTLVSSLFESELFGHVKGAFTGASANKMGKFELANGGTLFLDEIANIDLDLQAKLLKAVEEKVISRVGSHRLTKVDVRIIAATNQDLRRAVAAGAFREDLYFRLNVVALETPPLRERREDIPLLVRHFLERYGRKYQRPGLRLAGDAMRWIEAYHWPGNVRELENAVERLVIFARGGTIGADDLQAAGLLEAAGETAGPEAASPVPGEAGRPLPLDEVERRHVLSVLRRAEGNRSEAARLLGIDRKTLRQKLRRWGLEDAG